MCSHLPGPQIGLYTDNGGEKRYHNGTAEEGTLLVSKETVMFSLLCGEGLEVPLKISPLGGVVVLAK